MMNKQDIITYFFENDGEIPNNILPVVIYKNALEHVARKDLEVLFYQNGWGNNWHDIILTEDHFHSNTHEVLGLKSGHARLKLGGEKGEIVTVEKGDVIILPAGIGHFSVDNSLEYQFVGGYPNGADWNLKFSLKKEESSSVLAEIASIPLPDKDPVFGDNGPLFDYWT
ncbi:cupin [Aquirufa lenticrescens]